jgi:hypothetical protein
MKFVYVFVHNSFISKEFPSFSHEIKDMYRLNRCMVTGGRSLYNGAEKANDFGTNTNLSHRRIQYEAGAG